VASTCRDDDRGFSLIEVLAVVAVLGIIAAVAAPTITNSLEAMRLGASARELERQLQDARLKAVSTNRRIRVRTNCPATGEYRMVQVLGTTADASTSRCSESSYPFDASNQNPVTKLQDGPVKRLYTGVTVTFEQPTGGGGVEFWPDGRAVVIDGAGVRSAITTPVIVTLTKRSNTKRISVNGLGKIQLQ
jgi:prepilin-type N-terminal cleavage/methylation domain-containing protein